MQRAQSHYLRVAAMLLALGIIFSLFVLGAQPVAVDLIPTPWDKLAHGVLFALLACGIGFASGLQVRQGLAVAIVVTMLIAVLDEWHQVYLPGRQASWGDLAADIAGSIIGAVLLATRRRFG
ncbi:MAG: VanZ family protein [Nitrosospira sp.]